MYEEEIAATSAEVLDAMKDMISRLAYRLATRDRGCLLIPLLGRSFLGQKVAVHFGGSRVQHFSSLRVRRCCNATPDATISTSSVEQMSS